MNERFEKLLKGIPQSTPPIWFMRQAGRIPFTLSRAKEKTFF